MANILIVDSYFSVGLLYREVLQERGHRVFIVMSGKEALVLGLHEKIDIAVVADKIPDFEAEELLRKLRHLQRHILGVLSVSSTFGLLTNPGLWNAVFLKSNDFRILEAEIERLLWETSTAVSEQLLKEGEYKIVPKFA
jgi:DNA-binding response OmpR family regulator